jgi:2-phosphosulfolactate phosphatase
MEMRFVGIEDCGSIDGVAVVIDVLRAFSFAAYALDAGADRLILVEDLDEALRLAVEIPGALAGKDGMPAEGFDLFNSPGQILEGSDLGGRTIVHRTAAGTVGAAAARHAQWLFCASFVVAEATVDRIRRLDPRSVTFVVTGGGGHADEDVACAEYLAARLGNDAVDPAPFLARAQVAGQRLLRAVEMGYEGVHRDDLALCLELDRFTFALTVVDQYGQLTLQKG